MTMRERTNDHIESTILLTLLPLLRCVLALDDSWWCMCAHVSVRASCECVGRTVIAWLALANEAS